MVNLELYKVFYTVARCGSLTKAAEELYISQPAVSQAIKQLEGQLGTPLFNRLHRGMELSAQGGEVIFEDVEKALKLLAGVEDRLEELRDSPSGTLRIGASETIFQYLLPDRIAEYHRLYPKVRIELIEGKTPLILESLKNDRCDVGFLNLPIRDDSDLRMYERVSLLNDIFIAGKGFEELAGRTLTLGELKEYPLLLLDRNTVAREAFDAFAESMGETFTPAVEVDSWGLMKQLVERGMGIGVIPREYAIRRLREGTIFELNVTPPLPSRSVGMAVPRERSLSFSLRLFLKMFSADFK